MPPPGRKPTPTSLKILRGTRADRIPAAEPRPAATRPKCPGHLDATAKRKWRELVPILERMRVLTEAEGTLLTLLCEDYSLLRQAGDDIREHGLLMESGTGGWKTNPAVYVAAGCRMRIARNLAELGCTPSSRSRVEVKSEAPKDALAEFLGRRRGGA